jgi:hypothetical protein
MLGHTGPGNRDGLPSRRAYQEECWSTLRSQDTASTLGRVDGVQSKQLGTWKSGTKLRTVFQNHARAHCRSAADESNLWVPLLSQRRPGDGPVTARAHAIPLHFALCLLHAVPPTSRCFGRRSGPAVKQFQRVFSAAAREASRDAGRTGCATARRRPWGTGTPAPRCCKTGVTYQMIT